MISSGSRTGPGCSSTTAANFRAWIACIVRTSLEAVTFPRLPSLLLAGSAQPAWLSAPDSTRIRRRLLPGLCILYVPATFFILDVIDLLI